MHRETCKYNMLQVQVQSVIYNNDVRPVTFKNYHLIVHKVTRQVPGTGTTFCKSNHHRVLVVFGFRNPNSYCIELCRSMLMIFAMFSLLTIVSSDLLTFRVSGYPFSIFTLFLNTHNFYYQISAHTCRHDIASPFSFSICINMVRGQNYGA